MTAKKHNSLFLFLALACFLGIVIIFIFDGYIGLYDTLVISNGQYDQTITGDQWAQQAQFGGLVSASVDRNGLIDFTYTIENHRFSRYNANLNVSLWYNKVKTSDIYTADVAVPAFGKQEMKWSLTAGDIVPASYPTGQTYLIVMKINVGGIGRELTINIFNSGAASKTAPVPTITIPPPTR